MVATPSGASGTSGSPSGASGTSGSPSGASGSPGAGRWLSLAQAAAAQGVGPDALRKRIPTGQVRARKRAGRWQVWVPAADLGIRMVPDDPDAPDVPRPDAPDAPDYKREAVPDAPDAQRQQTQTQAQEPPQGAQTALLAQRAQEMAAYTERLLAPLHARLEAQAERIGTLTERLAAAEAEIAELKAPAPEPPRAPSPGWEARRWWQRLLWG
jgi:hypothetical protein